MSTEERGSEDVPKAAPADLVRVVERLVESNAQLLSLLSSKGAAAPPTAVEKEKVKEEEEEEECCPRPCPCVHCPSRSPDQNWSDASEVLIFLFLLALFVFWLPSIVASHCSH